MKLNKGDKWIVALIIFGYAGAALRWSTLLGLWFPGQGIGCPVSAVCILTVGVQPKLRFFQFVLLEGTQNATLFLLFGGFVWAIVKLLRRFKPAV